MKNIHYNILFSIPVHEEVYVVIDQLFNFTKYNKHCAIVLHLSPSFKLTAEQLELLNNVCRLLGNIYINPERIKTGESNIIKAHLSNYIFVKNLSFDYFALSSSNELFFKSGLFEHIKQFDCVFPKHKVQIDTNINNVKWYQMKMALNDESLKSVVKRLGGHYLYGCQIEGSYYKKNIFHEICELINLYFDTDSFYNYVYAREEIFFPTICSLINSTFVFNSGGHFTYINWSTYPDLNIKIKDIKTLYKQSKEYFSVKRVARRINDYVRIYLRRKGGYYLDIKHFAGSAVRKRESIVSFLKRKYKSLRIILYRIKRLFTGQRLITRYNTKTNDKHP